MDESNEQAHRLTAEIEHLQYTVKKLVAAEADHWRDLETLNINESLYRHIVEDQTDLICRFRPGGIITFVNRAICDYLGKTPKELIGESYYSLIPQENLENLQNRLASLTRENHIFIIVNRVSMPDGKTRWLHWTNRAIYDRRGRFIEYQTVGRDITALKEAEEMLRLSEEKYRGMLDNITDGVYKINRDGYFTYLNHISLKRSGLPPDGYQTFHYLDRIIPEEREKVRAKFERVMRGEENPPYELQMKGLDNNTYYLEVKSKPIFSGGHVVEMLGISRDITARKRAEEALQRSEEKYHSLLESISDGVYQLDTRGYFSFMNRVSLERTGLSPDRFNAVHFLDIVTPEEHERVRENFERVMRGEEVPPYEVSYLGHEGEKHFAEVRTRPIFKNGDVVGLVGISRDITARKQAEELLLNAKQLLQEMVNARTRELEDKTAKLTESENRYRAIFEHTGTAMAIIEEDMTVSLVNNELAKLLGLSKEQIEGKTRWTEFVWEKDVKRLKAYHRLRRTAVGTAPESYECRIINRQGTVLDILVNVSVIPGTKKSVASLLDITVRKNTENALRQSEQKIKAIVNSVTDFMSMIDDRHQIVWANDVAQRVFGTGLVGGKCYSVFHGLDRPCPSCAVRETLTDGNIHEHEIGTTTHDGQRMVLWCTASVVEHHEDGRPRLVIEVLRDITERKLAEETLREREKELALRTRNLQEMNTALNVLLRKLETDKLTVEDNILANTRENILPYLDELEKTTLDESQRLCVNAIRKNIKTIVSPFMKKIKSRYPNLSPKETQVARLIAQGQTTKDIATILKISIKAVEFHRYNIRKKLRITGKTSTLHDILAKLNDRH